MTTVRQILSNFGLYRRYKGGRWYRVKNGALFYWTQAPCYPERLVSMERYE